MKRTPLKAVSAKRRRRNAAVKPFRDAYLAAHWLCEVCIHRQSACVHEICRGPARDAALDVEDAVLAVCEKCHRLCEDYSVMPVTRQLAVKALRGSKPPDLEVINKLRGRAPTAIVWADVAQHLRMKD